ncbi:Oxysterol-binding protein-related protein 1C [Platanthera zijinensis]|uniref:Oxysterol-binding protein-related protein 1C n=1 Tax=Platanthera zijinensis TaxID=2320716 RepID=A0AAP0BJ03_9ASPA
MLEGDSEISSPATFTLSSFPRFLTEKSQVRGVVQNHSGKTMATLFVKWDDSMHYVIDDPSMKGKGAETLSQAQLLWNRSTGETAHLGLRKSRPGERKGRTPLSLPLHNLFILPVGSNKNDGSQRNP